MQGVTFERLPPERSVIAPSAASAGSCCCCCCCCLHTVGSIVGALSAKTPTPPEGNEVPTAVVGAPTAEPAYTVTKEYWLTLLIMSLVGFPLVLIALSGGEAFGGSLGEWALIYAIFMPAIQLATSIFVGIRNTYSSRPGKQQRIQHLSSITVRAFLGTLIGILVMLVMFGIR
jgi:hypothetical protein